jgi:hypothetical protein
MEICEQALCSSGATTTRPTAAKHKKASKSALGFMQSPPLFYLAKTSDASGKK